MELSKGNARRLKVLELIKDRGKVTLQEIVEAASCSEATARRDLEALEQAGKIIRTIGGAVYEGAMTHSQKEQAFAEKRFINRKEKERIAAAAAAMVQEGDVVCLTGGTTTFLIAKALKHHSNITVVTNAVNIAAEMVDAEGVQVVVIGGVMRGKSYELIGPLAEQVVSKINVTKMFLGVDGVSPEHGFTMHSEMETRIAQLLIERSSSVYAVFDNSKLRKTALFTIVPLSGVTGAITDSRVDAKLEQACKEQSIELHIAEA